jgi:hypothetical protein
MVPVSKKESNGTLATSCQAVTYKFVENSGKKQPNRRTGQK